MKNPWVVLGVILVVIIGGSVWYSGYAAEKNNEGVDANIVHAKGGDEGAVTLVEYSDFQCPACAAFQPIVSDVLDTFGDDVRFEYKHFPLSAIHPFAEQAARAAEAAGQQGKFFEYHDLLFAGQDAWTATPNPTVFFMRYAEELDLDMDKFSRHMRSTILRDKVRADAAKARELALTGTPSFFLNGTQMKIETYQDFFDQIARAVDPSYGMASSSETGTADPAPTADVRFGL